MKSVLLAAAAAIAFAAPALAFDAGDKQAIRDEVRAYLLENPEVVIEALQAFDAKQAKMKEELAALAVGDNAEAIFNDGYSLVRGNPDGDITLVEFLDYRCGYCKKAHEEVAKFLKADGDVRWVVKEFPVLGEMSVFAGRAALAAKLQDDDAKYAAYSDALMTYKGQLDQAAVFKLAADAGLDADKIKTDMAGPVVDERVRKTYELARKLNINGTPGFVLGAGKTGELIPGFVPASELARIAAAQRAAK